MYRYRKKQNKIKYDHNKVNEMAIEKERKLKNMHTQMKNLNKITSKNRD